MKRKQFLQKAIAATAVAAIAPEVLIEAESPVDLDSICSAYGLPVRTVRMHLEGSEFNKKG